MKQYILLLAILCSIPSIAQIKTPQPSPESTITQTVGLTEVTVNYSRPSKKDRVIFGDLVPYNELWRTGANGSTDITFNSDIQFGGTNVPAGKYAIYTYPSKSSWKVLLYSNSEHWGTPGKEFDQSKVVAETVANVQTLTHEVETFTIGFDALRNNSANLTFSWGNVYVEVPIEVDTKTAVEESIQAVMSGPSANDYYAAAAYYLDEGMNLEQALEWVNAAIELKPEAFWMVKAKSEIQAGLGNYKEAIATAKQAKDAADKAGNKQYVKFNDENIAKWKTMK